MYQNFTKLLYLSHLQSVPFISTSVYIIRLWPKWFQLITLMNAMSLFPIIAYDLFRILSFQEFENYWIHFCIYFINGLFNTIVIMIISRSMYFKVCFKNILLLTRTLWMSMKNYSNFHLPNLFLFCSVYFFCLPRS